MVARDFETILKGKYPGKAHARKAVGLLSDTICGARGAIYLAGCPTKLLEDSDEAEPFRQRRHFFYLTGCNLPDCHFIYDIQGERSILFIPPVDADEVIWCGLPMSIEEALKEYDVDEVRYNTEIASTLQKLSAAYSSSTIFTIADQYPQHLTFEGFANHDAITIKRVLDIARVVKDEYEVAMIRKANHISGLAHESVMQQANTACNEMELEAVFLGYCTSKGAKKMAYPPIFAGGRAAATLHYEVNNAPLTKKLNILVDAGAEWENYASDITRTYPLSGKFSHESRAIYNIVLRMQKECIAIIREGVNWDDLHMLAHEVVIEGLLGIGILKGDKATLLESQTSMAFFPHGLGHYLGLDTHDVGGNPGQQQSAGYFRYLRKRGPLPAGAVITVEPGIYFCRTNIEPYLQDPKHSKYIDSHTLERYWGVGGVRIEDNVLVTVNGYENLTNVIKEVDELESLISSRC